MTPDSSSSGKGALGPKWYSTMKAEAAKRSRSSRPPRWGAETESGTGRVMGSSLGGPKRDARPGLLQPSCRPAVWNRPRRRPVTRLPDAAERSDEPSAENSQGAAELRRRRPQRSERAGECRPARPEIGRAHV